MNQTEIKENQPYLVVYNDKNKVLAKSVWSLLSTHNLQIIETDNIETLKDYALNAILIVTPLEIFSDDGIHLPSIKQENPRIVADILAFLPVETSNQDRMAVLAEGFDGVFNSDFIDYPAFKKLLLTRVQKGLVSLENRNQQEEYKRFKSALAASPDAFIVLDENQKLFFVSEHYKNAYPQNKDKLVRGLDINKAFDILSAEQQVYKGDPRYEVMRKFWQDPKGHIEFTTQNGKTWRLSAQKLADGQGTIVTTTDITEYLQQKREIEIKSEALEEALKKEQAAGAIQKQFVNMVSHEFRTPLGIIDGHAQIIQRRAKRISMDDVQERIKIMRSAVSRLISMMEGILSSNMLQAGKMTVIPQETDVKALIKSLCDEHLHMSSDLKIDYHFKNVPEQLSVDQKIFTLAVSNILSNAIKFSPDNPFITLHLAYNDDTIRLAIKDNGIGIPESEIDKVFDRYFRSTLASGIPGSGIGLDLTKSLVEMHGGTIEVSSTQGQGTRFLLTFKIV